jgi:signal transduction histidine kinase/ketosteroid isomerase-like protein
VTAIWSHSADVSNQGPFGDRMDGWDAVGAQFRKEAGMKLSGRVTCRNQIVRVGRDLGYTVCVEQGENMTAAGKRVNVSHRATNVFRLESGQWRLVHHHTDLSPQLDQAGAGNAYGSAEEARAMLLKAVAAVKADKDKALDMFNKGEAGFLDRDLYPFCIDISNGAIVAQGGPLHRQFPGQDMRRLKDATGKAYGIEIFTAVQKQEGVITEISYMFPKPIVGSPPVPKISYVTRIAAIGCGVGYYATSAQPVSRDEAVAMVQKAMAAIKTEADEKTYRQIDKPSGQFVDRELYIVVFRLDGTILAHGADASRIGRDTLKATDPDGRAFNRERVELAQKQPSFWHDYKFMNPVTRRIEPKQLYCERLDQKVVCGGIYPR